MCVRTCPASRKLYIYDYSPSNPDCPDPSNPVRTTWVVEAVHASTHVEMKPLEE